MWWSAFDVMCNLSVKIISLDEIPGDVCISLALPEWDWSALAGYLCDVQFAEYTGT